MYQCKEGSGETPSSPRNNLIAVFVAALLPFLLGTARPLSANPLIPTPLETRVLGQTQWLSGSKASLRVIASDHQSGKPAKDARVRILLADREDKEAMDEQTLFTGFTNAQGTIDASFAAPKWPKGNYDLTVRVSAYALGTDSISRTVWLDSATQILLTTDKPLYQPGQTIHLRALALEKPDLNAAAGKPLLLEVEDAKGNKVMKRSVTTSKFGIGSVDFTLASEVNMGRFTLRAALDDSITEKKVTVERYVLPKFKAALKTDRNYYLPGEKLHGTVQADYFFGKPVSSGKVTVRLSSFDVGFNQFAEVKGTTDDKGTYSFDVDLPNSFAGTPPEQGKALVKIDTVVTDKAEHEEKATNTLPIAKEPIEISVIPEGSEIVPGLENRFYVLTSYPDGSPAATSLVVEGSGGKWEHHSNPRGISEVLLKPQELSLKFRVTATDAKGQSASVLQEFGVNTSKEAVLLRVSKAIYKTGETMDLDVFSPDKRGTVYLDVIRDRQTILTQTVNLADGRAHASLPLDEEVSGTLIVQAYCITKDGQIVRDRRIVYVNPANDLSISVKADRKVYLPQDKAKIEFSVSDTVGHPILAALGINIIDEAVYGLQEMQPGMEKVYFMLEKELLEPKYEVHGFDPGDIVKPLVRGKPLPPRASAQLDESRQQVARVLFAAASAEVSYGLDVNSYQEKAEKAAEAWNEAVQAAAQKIGQALSEYAKKNFGRYPDSEVALRELADKGFLKPDDTRDPLGNPYTLTAFGRRDLKQGFSLRSYGLDGKPDTQDDITVFLYRQRGEKGDEWVTADPRKMDLRRRLGRDFFEAVPMAMNGAAVMEKAADATQPTAAPPGKKDGEEPARIRQYFPETLYFNPAVITDDRGNASIDVTMADSITTWRLTTMASSALGALGSTTAPLRVFQDFFIDIDLPVSLTQNDSVHIPVAVYNYLPKKQTVRLALQKEDWFDTSDALEQKVDMDPEKVGVVYFPITVKKIGNHKLLVKAFGSDMSDAIQRQIEVMPDGEEQWSTINDRLEGNVAQTISIPANAIDEASTIFVKIYPGTFSQVVEGLDKMLRMPSGCFEQTSSMTYPNVLVTDYMKRTKKINPEIQMKAEQYINLGYQRLVTFEVQGGGFSWFGDAPAHKVLTAYGLMEFSDMAKVHEVDPAVITRTQQWLAKQQKADGSWEQDQGGIAEGIINRQTDVLRTSAYIAWALADSGYKGPEVEKAVNYVAPKIDSVNDAYVAAVNANLMVACDRKGDRTLKALEKLVSLKVEKDKVVYWTSSAPTMTNGKGETADLETTGLAVYALLKSGRYPGLVNKALTYLVQNKDAFGTWQTTQATVWSMKALTLATDKATGETNAEVTVSLNGKKSESFAITPEDSDVMRQIDLKPLVQEGKNEVAIQFSGEGGALYQISARYYTPWTKTGPADELLSIDVNYDRTELAVNDFVTCNVRIANNQRGAANMVVVDLGIPPGFDVQTGDLAELVGSKALTKFELTGRQAILYLDRVEPGKPVTFDYRLKAKYPLKAKTPKSTVYEYYAPKVAAVAKPVEMVVK
ncbi:MAG: hypothetical protein AUJ92_01690 [Armatimonadetes bacterium CG2_30_59_28]|nr:MAG: hypothetical protein AUJ92_01690 [Armatimonadetes bacterium CG2_30_59_28]